MGAGITLQQKSTDEAVDRMVGRVLDKKYRLVRLLGAGGMGTVFEAEHLLLGSRVAIKVLNPIFTEIPDAVNRFLREGQAASKIGHPNIVYVQDIGSEDDGTIYLVMELLKGQTLKKVLEQRVILTYERAVAIILQVLSALHAAHQKGIVHRDLKPDNIFLSTNARDGLDVKLVDFGVAKFQGPEGKELSLTKTGNVLGTPNYLAPEQASGGKNIDERIDFWSVGVMLYEMITGRLPFVGDNYNEVLGNILLMEFVPLRELAPEVPEGLAAAVEKALSKKREGRFSSAAEMLEALAPYQSQAEDLMSTTSIQALKRSLLPPPYEPDENGDVSAVSGSGSGSFDETIDSSILEVTDSAALRPRESKRQVAIIAAIGVVIAVTLSSFFWSRSRTDGDGALEVVTAGEQDPPDQSPTREEAVNPPVESEKDISPPAEPPAKQAAAPIEVTISIRGVPPQAEMLLNRKTVEAPFKTARSDKPMLLEITAPGYNAYEKLLVPNEDQTVEISMQRKHRRKAKRQSPPEQTEKTTGKPSEGWQPNPFGK